MRQKLVIGNWKMHSTALQAQKLAKLIADGIKRNANFINTNLSVVICPPFPYLGLVGEILKGSGIELGAQNLFPESEGAFTGEVSPTMLLDLGCKYVIVGHSERRECLGESDSFINKKVLAALKVGLNVILCVGETLEQRDAKLTEQILNQQLINGLAGVSADSLSDLCIAYEPVWAIGSGGHQATPKQAQDEHAVIRSCFGQKYGEQAAHALSILYGGSVSPENATSLFARYGVDGVLIGADSLDSQLFLPIIQSGIKALQFED